MELSTPFIARSCPTCLLDTGHSKSVFSKTKAESLPFSDLSKHWHGFFKEPVFFSYDRCNSCGILFCPKYFSPKQLETLYSQMPDNTAGVPLESVRKTQYSYFKTLKKYSKLKGSLLEIGPDIGLFTEACATEGQFDTFWLYEPNKAVHTQLTASVHGRTHHIRTEMFNYDEIPNESISTTVMVHVLDHVLDPERMLLQIREKMEKGGIIAIVTHNEGSLLPALTKNRWPAYCLQHPQLFNPNSIQNLLKKAGYNTLGVHRTVNHFPVGYLMKHAFWAAGLMKLGSKVPNVNKLSLPLKLGNMITIGAKT